MASRRAAHMAVVLTAAGALTVACGQKGPPLAPLHLVPAAATEVSVRRVGRSRAPALRAAVDATRTGRAARARSRRDLRHDHPGELGRAVEAGVDGERAAGRRDRRASRARRRRGRAPGRKAAGAGRAGHVRRGTDDAEAHAGRGADATAAGTTCRGDRAARRPPPQRRRAAAATPATATPAPATTAAPAPHTSGTRSNGTGRRAAGGDSAGSRRSGRSGRGNGCRAWSGSSGRGSDCCPGPGRRGRAAQAGDGAVHAPSVCRAWRDPQGGGPGARLERSLSLPLVPLAPPPETVRARFSETAVDRRVGCRVADRPTAYNVYRGDGSARSRSNPAPLKSAVVRADAASRSVRSSATGCAARRAWLRRSSKGEASPPPVCDAARPVRAGSARAGWRPCRPPARSA